MYSKLWSAWDTSSNENVITREHGEVKNKYNKYKMDKIL